jgi:hypothetical protein
MSITTNAAQRQRWRFERLIAVAQSAYRDGQGELATWALQVAWVAAESKLQIGDVSAGAQFMLEHPIDGIDYAILQDLADGTLTGEITLSA